MDRELNSTPFGRFRILNLSAVPAIIGVPISCISSHFRFSKTVKSISTVSILNQLVVIIILIVIMNSKWILLIVVHISLD